MIFLFLAWVCCFKTILEKIPCSVEKISSEKEDKNLTPFDDDLKSLNEETVALSLETKKDEQNEQKDGLKKVNCQGLLTLRL